MVIVRVLVALIWDRGRLPPFLLTCRNARNRFPRSSTRSINILAFGSSYTWLGDLQPDSSAPCPAHTCLVSRAQLHARRLHQGVKRHCASCATDHIDLGTALGQCHRFHLENQKQSQARVLTWPRQYG